MGMTIAEKIIAYHLGVDSITPGMLVTTKVDFAMGEDATTPLAIKAFRQLGARRVFDPERIALITDHSTPNPSVEVAQQIRVIREFSREFNIRHFYEPGEVGVEHVLLPEKGLVGPGDIVVGADSHTTTYGAIGAMSVGVGSTDLGCTMATGEIWLKVPETMKLIYRGNLKRWVGGKDLILHTIGCIGTDGANYMSMEFSGDTIERLPIDDRFTMCNMAAEAGAKAAIVQPDDVTEQYVRGRCVREYKFFSSDPDASYKTTVEFNVRNLEPQVAIPFLPSNVKGVSELPRIDIDQAYIGSCTNGRMSDFRTAAEILRGKRKSAGVRLIVIPSTPRIYKQMIEEGLIEVFINAGAAIGPPTCGPCYGGHMGILAKGERAVSTSNRNFRGRMGHFESEVYLANPAVAAASAITGRISHPDEVV